MIGVTDAFKSAIRLDGRRIKAYLTDGVDEITEADDLQGLEMVSDGTLCGTVMRQAKATYFGTHTYLDNYVNLGIGCLLEDSISKGAFTVTIANPAVVTLTAHGLITGYKVKLATDGALPTGLTAGTVYYVVKVNDNTFNLAATYDNAMAGVKIATSGTQSGTHTLTYLPTALSDTPEYIDYGAFKVVEVTQDMASGVTTAKLYDRMYEALQQYALAPTYPITVLQLVQAICTELGWTLATTTFANSTLSIGSELFSESKLTYRQVLNQVAEASGSIMFFNSDDELEIRAITGTVEETLTTNDLITLKLEPIYQELNSVVLSRMPQEDNIAQQDAASIATYGLHEFKIVNNLIVDGDRETNITPIFNVLDGLTYYPFEAYTVGLGYFEVGDRIKVTDTSSTQYEVVVMGIELKATGGLNEKILGRVPDKTSTPYQYAGIIGQTIKNTEIIVDKQAGEIAILSAEVANAMTLPKQAEPPADPEVNDMYLDTDDNIIYIWTGSAWEATGLTEDDLTNYYTKDETNAQITLTADQINLSVEATQTTANSALALAEGNTDDIVSVQSDITSLTASVNGLEVAVSGIGGTNLLKNSVGLKGGLEEWQEFDETGTLIDADNNGTIIQTTDTEENTESGSGIRIDEQFIVQTVATIVGGDYTFYCRFKKLDDLDLTITGVSGVIPITAGEYVDETWAVFKTTFTATDTTTTLKISNVSSGTGSYAILSDMVCKLGDVNGWVQAPNEVYGRNFKFDKDGFSVTSLTDDFKATLDNTKLGIYDTSGATDRTVALFSKDEGLITSLTTQDEFTLQRYENSTKATRFIPTSTGCMITVND